MSWRSYLRDELAELARSMVDTAEAAVEEMEAERADHYSRMLETVVADERSRWVERLAPLWAAMEGRMSPEEAVDMLRVEFGATPARLAELAAHGHVWAPGEAKRRAL